MSGGSREASRDRDQIARHQHSFSENGRSSVPMWDSSDPERAPPPLPFPPGAGSPTIKANTSAGIAAAAKQIVERARESAPLSSYTSNHVTPQGSPERSLVKGAHHKRLQSLQTGSVKDLRSYLDGNRSPERSPERPSSRGTGYFSRQDSREDISLSAERSSTPTPAPKDPMKETPTLRSTTRPPPRAILSENTPPSSTMLALQTMHVPDDPLHDITNTPSTPAPMRVNTQYDFSSQLLHLTTIATSLQKEMSSLSRRSKDNATDLISLKDATNQRDEDIRKSLRELANAVGGTQGLLGPPPGLGSANRTTSSYSLLDNKVFNSPPSASKSWSVPRAASAHSFLEDVRVGSPSPYSVEGAASVAMLEKIIREMVTKEGQERLLSTLSELLEKSQQDNTDAARKVEELSQFIKEKSQSQALVSMSKDGPPKLELSFDSPGHLAKISREAPSEEKAANGEEILNLLKRIKESVAHTGGSTNEVKGLVRDLRGEVLGMGRELGRKLDQVSETQLNSTLDRSIEDGQGQQHTEEVQRIIEEGIAELKEHLSHVLNKRAEQDDDTFRQLSTARSGPSGDEMFAVVKHALAEHGSDMVKREPLEVEVTPGIDRDGVLDAVKEGLKDFEPNIELQQFGLERDEILAVLKEGLEEHQANRTEPAAAAIDKGEIFEVMQEALKDFEPPFPAEAMEHMKADILDNVRQALAEHQPAVSAAPVDDEAIRAAVTEAVKDGLANHGPAAPREIEISRDDLFDAVKASMDGSAIPFGSFGEQVLQKMRELVDNMHTEFAQYSAANGRDTEQVLDAVKDGLESLRAEIESYVDRAQDVTGKDEIVDTVRGGLERLRGDVQGYCASGPEHDGGKADMLEYIRKEFEHLHEAVGSRELSPEDGVVKSADMAEVLQTIKDGMESLKVQIEEKDHDLEIDFPTDEINDAMKEEFEQLKTGLLNAHAADKGELIETIQDSMGALHAKFGDSNMSSLSGGAGEEIINELHLEFDTLKETLQNIVAESEKDAVIDGVKQAIDDLRTQLAADNSEASAETLGAVKEELEKFKETMASSVVLGGATGAAAATIDHTEALEHIRGRLDEIKDTTATHTAEDGTVPTELLEAMRGEFENLRNSIATSVVHGGNHEEVIDAVRLGLDDLRGDLERKLDSPDRNQAQQSEMLDAINEGLETLRTDVVKTLDKPLDMTVNYEILDTLKEGLASLRVDIDTLKLARPGSSREDSDALNGGELVLAEALGEGGASREISEDGVPAAAPVAPESMKRADLEKMEVLLAQLQIKVEAMDATIQEMPMPEPAAHVPEDITVKQDLAAIEAMITEVQANVFSLASREPENAPEGAARKEDTDAIETLLRNTKAQLDEMAVPDLATAVTKEHLDAVEAVVRVTNEAMEGLTEKLENTTASKADVAVVEVLAQDVKMALEELKEKMSPAESEEEKPELMTKGDLDVLGVLCTEIKTRVNDMTLPDPEELPTKADVEQLQGLITDFRESHDKLKDSYETDIAVTAKAFDDRKQEFENTVDQISSIKDALAEIKDELLVKLADGESGINTLGETLKGLEKTAGSHEPVIAEVKEVMEALNREFERSHGSLEAMKVDHQQSAETALEKQAEHRTSMLEELTVKLDALFDGLMTKYDDAQHAAEEKAKVMEERSTAQADLLEGTKVMADDLRLSIDTLGTALTTFTGTFPDQMDKLTEESKTVFNKVDDTYNKLDETQEGVKFEHSITREEVAKAMTAIAGVQGELTEHNPRFLVTLKEVQALIGQHYDHSQKASATADQHHQAVRELQEQLRAGFEDSRTRHESQTAELKTALPTLLPAPVEAPAAIEAEKYDDSAVHEKLDRLASDRFDDAPLHEKLDKLMGHAEEAANPSAQLERLDQIHERVMATAAEVSAFVAAQAKQITEDHENKEKEAEELALLLERRLVQKDEIEADITVLNEEKESLQQAVEALRAEKDALASQKSRLNADASSLETALRIRREELHEMDRKAEMIERRMLEGVMNQSRMLLLAKGAKSSPLKKKPQGRDLRIPSNASAMSVQTVTSTVPALKPNHALALKTRPPMQRASPASNTAERRIMSLNQINHNVPSGAAAYSTTPSLVSSNASRGLQRSHSVKTQFANRKGSWAGKRNLSMTSHNKENETLSEESEDEGSSRPGSRDLSFRDAESEAGTERRTSRMSGTESGLTYGEGSYADGVTPGTDDGTRISYGTSDLSYGTGSYMTGSELDGRDSLSSSANGVVGMQSGIDGEHGDEEEEEAVGGTERDDEPLQLEAPQPMSALKHEFAPPSDSGLGTDLPTANLTDSEYFRGDAE